MRDADTDDAERRSVVPVGLIFVSRETPGRFHDEYMSSQQALNRAVSAAADVHALRAILSTARDEDVNAINCAAIAGKAAKIHAGRWTTESDRRACEETVQTIADRAERALRETPREWWPRQCSAMLWACGKVGRRHEGLERAVSGMIEARGGSAKPQELSNAMWGLAKVGSDARELYAYLGDRVRVSLQVDKGTDHRTGWTSQGVSNAAWSLGSMREAAAKAMFEESVLGREVVDGLANAVDERVSLFNPQECANTMWAFAKCSAYVPEESARGAKALVGRIKRERGWMSGGEFQCQHVSNVTWACAKLNMGDDAELVEILVETAREYANKFNAQELSMILWAFATMQAQDEKIMHGLAKAMARKVEESNAQQMATAAHAMAKVGVYNSHLMKAYKESAPTRVDGFQSRDVAFLAWAYAKLNVKASEIFDAFREKMRDAGFVDTFTPHHLTMVLWSFAMLSERTDGALEVMTERITSLVDSFNPRDLTNTAWALAALTCQDESLIRALGSRARDALNEFNSQELLKFLGAYERLGVNDDALAEAVSAQRTLSYDFPALGSSVSLTAATPQSYEGTDRVRVDDSCGGWGRGNTGVALWEGSFVLAEWLSRQKTPLSTEGIEKALAGAWGARASWDGKVGVELGAGLGLPSIIASKLGVTMIATDGAYVLLRDVVSFLLRSAIVNPFTGLSVSLEFQKWRTSNWEFR